MPSIPTGTVPGPETWFVDEGKVHFTAPVTPDVVDWWDRTFATPFDLTPLEMAGIVGRNMPDMMKLEFDAIKPADGRVSLVLTGEALSEFEMEVSYLFGSSVEMDEKPRLIHNDGSFVHNSLQRQGIGSQWIANLYVLAERLKTRVIGLQAKEAGPAIWPSFGFRPRDDEWKRIVPLIDERLATFRGVIGEDVFSKVRSDLSSPDPRRIWAIADRQELVMTAPIDGSAPPAQDTLAVALLAHSALSWYGFLDFDDQAAFARLEAKIKRYLP